MWILNKNTAAHVEAGHARARGFTSEGAFGQAAGRTCPAPTEQWTYLIGHKLCALIIDQRAALSFSVIFMLRQLGR